MSFSMNHDCEVAPHSEWHFNRYFELLAVSERDKKRFTSELLAMQAPLLVFKQLEQ